MDKRKLLLALTLVAIILGALLTTAGAKMTQPTYSYDHELASFIGIGIITLIGFFLFGLAELLVAATSVTFWMKNKKIASFIPVIFGLLGFLVTLLLIFGVVQFWSTWAILYLLCAVALSLTVPTLMEELQKEGTYGWIPKIAKGLFYLATLYFFISVSGMFNPLDGYILSFLGGIVGLVFMYQAMKSGN